jgi:hypothetical protein
MQFNYNLTGMAYSYNRTSDELGSTGTRVSGMFYDCANITSPTVRVVMNSGLAEGVDEFFSLKNGTTLLTFGPTLGEALADYLESAAGLDGMVCFSFLSVSLMHSLFFGFGTDSRSYSLSLLEFTEDEELDVHLNSVKLRLGHVLHNKCDDFLGVQVPNDYLILPAQINAMPCNASKPFETVINDPTAWAPIGAVAVAPPPGVAPPPIASNLDNNLGFGAAAPGAAMAVTGGNNTAGVAGVHAFSAAAIGSVFLTLALVM